MSTPQQPGVPTPPVPPSATPAATPSTPQGQTQKTSIPRKIWKVTDHPVVAGIILLVAGSVWGLITLSGGGSSSTPQNPAPFGVVQGFTAKVAWTDDACGGGSCSTTLYAYKSPNSHVRDGQYPLGESLTVVCETPHGRPIQVGPSYGGPDPASTVWYRLDIGAWVPAVYVRVDKPASIPTCS